MTNDQREALVSGLAFLGLFLISFVIVGGICLLAARYLGCP